MLSVRNVSFTIKLNFFPPISLAKSSSPSFSSSRSYLTILVRSLAVDKADKLI